MQAEFIQRIYYTECPDRSEAAFAMMESIGAGYADTHEALGERIADSYWIWKTARRMAA